MPLRSTSITFTPLEATTMGDVSKMVEQQMIDHAASDDCHIDPLPQGVHDALAKMLHELMVRTSAFLHDLQTVTIAAQEEAFKALFPDGPLTEEMSEMDLTHARMTGALFRILLENASGDSVARTALIYAHLHQSAAPDKFKSKESIAAAVTYGLTSVFGDGSRKAMRPCEPGSLAATNEEVRDSIGDRHLHIKFGLQIHDESSN